MRALRIGAIAVVLAALFQLSHAISSAGRQESVEGLEWALGALAVVFFLRALASEYSRAHTGSFQNDLQWGVALGLVGTIVSRLWE